MAKFGRKSIVSGIFRTPVQHFWWHIELDLKYLLFLVLFFFC